MATLDSALVTALGLRADAPALRRRRESAPGSRRRAASAPRSSRACSGSGRTIPRAGRARAAPERHRDARRGRVLGRADPRLRRLGAPERRRRGADVRASGPDDVAAPHPACRRLVHRLPVRLGRHEREGADAARPRRLPEASTARASSGASTSCSRMPGAPQLSDVLRGRTTMAMSGEVREVRAHRHRRPRARRRHLLRLARRRSRSRPRSITPASTSATAGSSTPRATASRSRSSTAGTRRASRGRGVP